MKFSDVVGVVRGAVTQVSSDFFDVLSHTSAYRYLALTADDLSLYLRKKFPTLNSAANVYAKSYDVKTIINQSLLANVMKYALPVIIYEGQIKPVYIDGSDYQNYIDYPMKLIFCGLYVCMFVNNAAYDLSLSKSLMQFTSPLDKKNACKCIETTRLAASFSNAFHNMGNIATGTLLCFAPRAIDYLFRSQLAGPGVYASYAVNSFAYGYCLVAMKYANQGVCARHRRAVVNNNKLFCFMVGASFVGLTQGGAYVLNAMAGSPGNVFVEDFVASQLYHFFVLFSILKVGTLKPDKMAVELFYYQRTLIDSLLRSRSNRLVQKLSQQEQKQSYTQMLNGYLDAPLVRAVASTTAISLLLSTHRDDIRGGIESIIKARGYPLWMVDYFLVYLTPDSIKILRQVLAQQGWEDTQVLVAKVVAIALKERARVDVAVSLMSAVVTREEYVAMPPEVEVRLKGVVNQIENYTPEEFVARLLTMMDKIEDYAPRRELKMLADVKEAEVEHKVDLGLSLRRKVRRHSWSEGGVHTLPVLFAAPDPRFDAVATPSPVATPSSALPLGSVEQSESDDEFEVVAEDTQEARMRAYRKCANSPD
jgi:hypothetical protein